MDTWLDATARVTGALWTQAHNAVTRISVNASLAFTRGVVYPMTLKPDALGDCDVHRARDGPGLWVPGPRVGRPRLPR
ncbi:MAG TPA: hypothetical protein VGF38_22010 [Ktedonobacterales bacterium]